MRKEKNLTRETSIFTKAFIWAGVSFGLIFIMALGISLSFKEFDLFGAGSVGRFDFNGYRYSTGEEAMLYRLSIMSAVLILASFICRMVWIFRIHRASKPFIIVNYILYIFAQGIGFGIVLATMNAADFSVVFGMSSAMFFVAALVGYMSNNLSKMGPYIFGFMMVVLIGGLTLTVLSLAGVNIETALFIWTIAGGILNILYIMYDVNMLKRFSQENDMYSWDEEDKFRYTAWFGFRLLTDFVMMIWYVLRLSRYFR